MLLENLGNVKEELFKEFLKYLADQKSGNKELQLPVDIFNNKKLSSLEAICKYLKENENFSFYQIAEILNRDNKTAWGTYDKAKKKLSSKFVINEPKYFIPISIFKNRKLGVLELICLYLKDNYGLTYHQIAVMLNRNDRTIWSSYNKAKGKIGK